MTTATRPTTKRKVIKKTASQNNTKITTQIKIVPESIQKIKLIESESMDGLYERGEMIHTLALCTIAQINALYLGVPGTAKTLTVKTVAESFCEDGDFYDILMAKTTKPDELFGPIDVKALTESGEQRRLIAGYAPMAKVAVFDEMWKASAAILNTLLTLVNEKRFRNGAKWVKCPLRFAVGMSNEFPDEPALLAALFDRFPVKVMIPPIQDDKNFCAMLKNGKPGTETRLNNVDLDELDKLVADCEVSDIITDSVCGIRADLKMQGVEISDRRWFQAIKVMKAEAVYNGRSKVVDSDLSVLKWIAWNQDGQQSIIESILPLYASPIDRQLTELKEEAYAERKSVMIAWNADGKDSSRKAEDSQAVASAGIKATQTVHKVMNAMLSLVADADTPELKEKIEAALSEVNIIADKIKAVGLGIRGDKSEQIAALAATE